MAERRVVLQSAADVTPRAPRWLWAGRLPLGNTSLVVGREGLGKTTVLTEVAARATKGLLRGDLHGQAADVIYATAEDSIEATLVPRFLAAGGDPARIHFLSAAVEEDGETMGTTLTLPQDFPLLADAVDTVTARLLILDPLVSYLAGQINAHRDQHVRRVLALLARLADQREMAAVGVVHLNKGEIHDVLARVSGSVGFTAAARSVLIVARDPDDPDGERGSQRIIAHAKCNLAPLAPSITGHIEAHQVRARDGGVVGTSRFVPTGEITRSASDLLAPPPSGAELGARAEAKTFLGEELAAGPIPTRQLQAAADAMGLSWSTIKRAKDELKIRARKDGTSWCWELPTPNTPPGPLGPLGPLEGNKEVKETKETTGTDNGGEVLFLDERAERLLTDHADIAGDAA